MLVTDVHLEADPMAYNLSDDCFYCGRRLNSTPLVMWDGHNGQVWLHQRCAFRLGTHIRLDAKRSNEQMRDIN